MVLQVLVPSRLGSRMNGNYVEGFGAGMVVTVRNDDYQAARCRGDYRP
jgi:hypothetical protein